MILYTVKFLTTWSRSRPSSRATYATWSSGPFEAACAGDVGRRCWAICVSSVVKPETRKGVWKQMRSIGPGRHVFSAQLWEFRGFPVRSAAQNAAAFPEIQRCCRLNASTEYHGIKQPSFWLYYPNAFNSSLFPLCEMDHSRSLLPHLRVTRSEKCVRKNPQRR